MFLDFVSIVDTLLGNTLHKEDVAEFRKSAGFKVYQKVGLDPANSTDDDRREFFAVVDNILGGLDAGVIKEFGRSNDFDTYKAIGELYK